MFKSVLSTRTNNFNDPDILEKITLLWAQAQEKLTGYSDSIYGVYHDYKSNYQDDYTLSIAIKSSDGDSTDGFIIPGKNYREFSIEDCTSEKIFQTWQKIWELEEDGKLNRQYDADYEEYRSDGTVSIFISIKQS